MPLRHSLCMASSDYIGEGEGGGGGGGGPMAPPLDPPLHLRMTKSVLGN